MRSCFGCSLVQGVVFEVSVPEAAVLKLRRSSEAELGHGDLRHLAHDVRGLRGHLVGRQRTEPGVETAGQARCAVLVATAVLAIATCIAAEDLRAIHGPV